MNKERLIKNIVDQMKEAQIKLGYVRETVRLYYTLPSLNGILGTEAADQQEMTGLLEESRVPLEEKLGYPKFGIHKGRIEISIPPEGAEYVYREVKASPFLADMIHLFQNHHCCSMEEIRNVFETYSRDYVCEKMPEGMDFDYVLYFLDELIDPYYYCVKAEMGHTIYHRFTKEDYQMLLNS
ncbi:MAG: DUF3877 family protein [Lachnospiraceae bacterium]|nr:DUF3877 family protein [Lachnospiraceae bacterium]